jgi:exosortase family protein XrtF
MLKKLKEQYLQIPNTVRLFIQRALLFFVVWKTVYDGFLQPRRIPDGWLTKITGELTAWLVSAVYHPAFAYLSAERSFIFMKGVKIIAIADGCNAFDLMVTYIGFLFCLPTHWKRTLVFMILGVLAIFLLNILRSCAIVWININYPNLFDLAHHYVFQILVYVFIFLFWVRYAQPVYGNVSKRRN